MRIVRRYWVDAVALMLAVVVFVVPFAFIIITAVKDRAEAARLDFSWPTSWHVWGNIADVVSERDYIFIRAMRNSFVLTIASVVLLIVVCSMAGFVLERRRDRMATFVNAMVLVGLIIPPAVVPTIYVLQKAHLFDTLWGLVLVEVAFLAPFSIILFRAFVATIPRELDEAAMIDGCSGLSLYFRVIFPLLRPVIITVIVTASVVIYNDFVNPLYFLPGSDNATVQLTLYSFQSQFISRWHLLFMDVLLITVPPLIMFMVFNRKIVAGLTGGAVKGQTSVMATTVRDLRADYGAEPLALGTPCPRLSWIVESDEPGYQQQSYTVAVRDSDDASGETTREVHSGDSVLVPWPFDPLRPRSRRRVRVRVTGATGDSSDWSEPLAIEIGLLDASDWTAVPVTADIDGASPERPIRFRATFAVRPGLVRARLYVSALGVYTAECNGSPIGDHVLAPGWTSYRHRLRYQTFDVTGTVQGGDNVLGITVAEGWHRGRLGFHGGRREVYGREIGPIAQLELHYEDGSMDTVVTDRHWRAGLGPFVSASLYDGEAYDARLAEPAWSTPIYDDRDWVDVRELPSVADLLFAPSGPPIRRRETIRAVSVGSSPSGATVVDFGQNISGRVRITVRGPAGHVVTLRHAEVLEHGELATRPLRGAAATDTFILAGQGVETYEPAFTIHGFRYAQVDGWPGDLTTDAIEAVVCHSDLAPTGTFDCSHAGLNQLHENIRWSMRGNFVDVPTDCPQRDERLGWTGDIQVFAPAAAFLYDCRGFLTSWLRDLAAEQGELGTVPAYVPWVDLVFPVLPAAAWGDASVVVPWVLYEQFGDVEVLRRQYDSMRAWVDQVAELSGEDHLWDEGFQFGDWLDPAAPPDDPALARTDAALVATAYHAHTARLLARVADVLGHDEDGARYEELADRVVEAFNREYVTPSGRLASDAQTAYALALRFDLLTSEAQRTRAASRLSELVRQESYCIGTGFVGTPLVCDALVEAGFVDDAYHLLLQTECPSWLYPVSMGATTVWERWDSMLPDGSINVGEMTSFNHYALGAVADFLHRVVAGIAPAEPGYRRLLVRPRPGGGLTEAGVTLRTPYGHASVRWRRPADRLVVDVVVPAGVTATIELPGRDAVEVASGTHRFECSHRTAELDPSRPPRPVPLLLESES